MWRINKHEKTGDGRFSRTHSHQKSKHTGVNTEQTLFKISVTRTRAVEKGEGWWK